MKKSSKKIKSKPKKDVLWGIWTGEDTGYFCYWAFAPTRSKAIQRLQIMWPCYAWKDAYADGCRAVKVSIKEVVR